MKTHGMDVKREKKNKQNRPKTHKSGEWRNQSGYLIFTEDYRNWLLSKFHHQDYYLLAWLKTLQQPV